VEKASACSPWHAFALLRRLPYLSPLNWAAASVALQLTLTARQTDRQGKEAADPPVGERGRPCGSNEKRPHQCFAVPFFRHLPRAVWIARGPVASGLVCGQGCVRGAQSTSARRPDRSTTVPAGKHRSVAPPSFSQAAGAAEARMAFPLCRG
jgi:hypothetical protein